MLEFLNPFREMTTVSVILRMVMATLVGAVIGLEGRRKTARSVSARISWCAWARQWL